MISFKRWMNLVAALFILSFLFFLGSGCSTYQEAVAAPLKVTPVPAQTASPPAEDIKKQNQH